MCSVKIIYAFDVAGLSNYSKYLITKKTKGFHGRFNIYIKKKSIKIIDTTFPRTRILNRFILDKDHQSVCFKINPMEKFLESKLKHQLPKEQIENEFIFSIIDENLAQEELKSNRIIYSN